MLQDIALHLLLMLMMLMRSASAVLHILNCKETGTTLFRYNHNYKHDVTHFIASFS